MKIRKKQNFFLKPLLALALIVLIVQPSSSQMSDQVKILGLKDSVRVIRDKWGINHIYAGNDYDLFYMQGYAAAKDRLFQLEIWRRQANGTMAELLGPAELTRDIGARLFKYRGDEVKELNHYHDNGVEIINAFVDGINAYIDEVSEKHELLPDEFKYLNILPGKWSPDIVVSRHQGLKGNAYEELQTGRAVAIAGAKEVKRFKWYHPQEPDITLDPSITAEVLSSDILKLYNSFDRRVTFENTDLPTAVRQRLENEHNGMVVGSNNWVISGTRTASGMPHLANDPHRSMTLPTLRYLVHLHAPGWNVIGAGEPAIPGVSIGHNDHGAWGLTIYETDAEDIFVYDLHARDLSKYRYKGKWVKMSEIDENISVKGQEPVTATLRYTVHGPVTYIDTARRKAFALKAGWLEPGGAPYLASLRLNQSTTWHEFVEACRYSHLPGENMIWADRDGNIGWQVVGIAPIREKSSGLVPVPGDGRFDWSGYLDIRERPAIKNPAQGFWVTANENVTPDDYAHWNTVGFTWADPYRGNRIREVLRDDSIRTLESEAKLQTDYYSIPARTLTSLLMRIPLQSEKAIEARNYLKGWNFQLEPTSVAAGIYAMWERIIYRESRKLVPAELTPYLSIQLHKLLSWLTAKDDNFEKDFPGGRAAFLQQTFETAVETLNGKLGPSINDWHYGQPKYKHIDLRTPLYHLLPDEDKEKNRITSNARGGNAHTPNATGGSDNQRFGAPFRMITDLSDWDRTLMINAPGQSGDIRSKYFSNLFELWDNEGFFPAYFSIQKIMEHADKTTLFLPR